MKARNKSKMAKISRWCDSFHLHECHQQPGVCSWVICGDVFDVWMSSCFLWLQLLDASKSFRGLQQSVQRATAHRGVDPCAINEGNDHGVDFEHLGVYDAVSCCFDNHPNMQGCKTMKTHIMIQSVLQIFLIMCWSWYMDGCHNHRHLAVAWRGTVLSFLLYGSVSVLGVLAFGVAEGQKDSLILDLMPVRKEVHVLISLLAVAWWIIFLKTWTQMSRDKLGMDWMQPKWLVWDVFRVSRLHDIDDMLRVDLHLRWCSVFSLASNSTSTRFVSSWLTMSESCAAVGQLRWKTKPAMVAAWRAGMTSLEPLVPW